MQKMDKLRIDIGDALLACSIAGTGEPLLLISGMAATMDYWGSPFMRPLLSVFRVITFDHRGMGISERGKADISIVRLAEDAAALLDALSIRKAHILGWSMGSFIAQELALNHPEKADRLVLYAGHCGGDKAVQPSPQVADKLFGLSGTPEQMTKRVPELLFPASWVREHPGLVKAFDARPMKVYIDNLGTIKEQAEAINSWDGTCGRLAGLEKKTLLLTGTEDIVVPPCNSDIMAELIPDSKVVKIDGGGHGMIYQFPRKVAEAVIDFLS